MSFKINISIRNYPHKAPKPSYVPGTQNLQVNCYTVINLLVKTRFDSSVIANYGLLEKKVMLSVHVMKAYGEMEV
jgi:hypothetical protein